MNQKEKYCKSLTAELTIANTTVGHSKLINVNDFSSLNEKLKEFNLVIPETVAILPSNLEDAKSKKDLFYAGTTPTVRVLLKQAGIAEKSIEEKKEIPHLDMQSFDWFGPTIIIASSLIAQNSDIVDRLITSISIYLNEWFKGVPKSEQNVELHIVTQTKKGNNKKVDYSGSVEGLKELPKVIRSLTDEQ